MWARGLLFHACFSRTPTPRVSACLSRLASNGSNPVAASVIELLSRAARRLSAHSPRLAAGAATLAPADLSVLQGSVTSLITLLDEARNVTSTQRMPLPPPEPSAGEVRGTALFPHLDKVAANVDVESLAGDTAEPPILVPVNISQVPDSVETFRDVSNALQRAVEVCTLLANQRGIVSESYALRFSLLSHLFLRVLPLPLPIGREDRTLSCFWAKRGKEMHHDTQAEIMRWLSVLARHFACASLSVPLAPTSDATRLLVFASITAIADAVLRVTACDVPSAFSLHYSGSAEGPAKPFALDMRQFEAESERCQLPSPHLAASRTILLDYFRAAASAVPDDRHLFKFERSMDMGSGERALLTQISAQLAFPRHETNLRAYLSAEDPALSELFPELLMFRDITYLTKAMIVPTYDQLPELRAWTAADARLMWQYKGGEGKDGVTKAGAFVVRGFGMEMKCSGWLDANGSPMVHKQGFLDRLLGKGGPKPRLQPSSADPAVLAGANLATEDDVLFLRHLPDFRGALRAGDVEYMLQVLLAPYLRIPLLLRFFADPVRTSALSQPELQQMLDAALFEPGEWQPDVRRNLPTVIPDVERTHLKTPAGCLFNELTHAAAPSISAVSTILDNALELDSGRYVRGGSSSTILYAIRLATRVEAYITYLLSADAEKVRGLNLPGTPDFGGDSPAKAALRASAAELRKKLLDLALPVLQGWYARLRRDTMTRDASTVAAHLAFIYGDAPTSAPSGNGSGGNGGGSNGSSGSLDARQAFVMLSTRVYLNVHHDFELEPELMLTGRQPRKRTIGATSHTATSTGELGYAPLEVFDLWQKSLHHMLNWLDANPEQASDVMEATVRLLSGRDGSSHSAAPLVTRSWASMQGCGSEGRFTPIPAENEAEGKGGANRAGWGSKAEAEALAAAAQGGYPAWLRVRVSAAAETEINVQLGEMTLKRHHMQLLEAAVAQHEDFVAVFGQGADGGRHQCAEVKRSSRRRWLRLLGTRHDVTIWGPDDRAPPVPRAAMLQGALSPWVQATLDPIKTTIPQLTDPNLSLTLTEVGSGHATLAVAIDGVLKEMILQREPAALHIFNVVEHGRRWIRELIYTSDASRCYGTPSKGETGVVLRPTPHWHAGDIATPAIVMSSLVVSRSLSQETAATPEFFVPMRQLNGLLPTALIELYLFWRSHDGTTLTGKRIPKDGGGAAASSQGAAAATAAGGGAAAAPSAAPAAAKKAAGVPVAGKDVITVACSKTGSVVTRTPCDIYGTEIPGESRRLLATLSCSSGTGLGALIALLERIEDLSHVLVWSGKKCDVGVASNNPFGNAAASAFGGGESMVAVALIELPRLALSFEAVKRTDGSVRLYSKEHPGHYIGHLQGERKAALVRGLPHALTLINEEGDPFVLLSALAKPCRLSDPAEPLASQLLISRHSSAWLASLTGVRHYLYAMHRSQAFLVPPSLAACLNLLALRWLARDYEAAFALCPACVSDSLLAADEKQLWELFASFDDDVEPETHALRLRLSLAARSCPEMPTPWSEPEQLSLYLTKLAFIPASCQLSAQDELTLLRTHGASSAEARSRIAFLDAALDAALAIEAVEAANNPWASSAPPVPQMAAVYPPRPTYADFDVPMEPAPLLLQPEALAAWQKKLTSMSYSRPEESSGLGALKLLSDWISNNIKIDSDSRGFWLLYELLTGTLNFKILLDDQPHVLGALLLRLAVRGHGDELHPILRLMEVNRNFATEMPKFEDTRKKGGLALFKGKAGKGMPERIHASLQQLLPRLPEGGRQPSHQQYVPPTALPMPPLRELRALHRTWLAPAALGVNATERSVPAAFVPPTSATDQVFVLQPLDPISYTRRAAASAGAQGRLPRVEVERHPATATVVAQRMLRRVVEDVQWLTSAAAQAALEVPKFIGFEGSAVATSLPSMTELQGRERNLARLTSALEQLYTQDQQAYDVLLVQVQSLVTAGGGAASDAMRAARSLAQLAGCELNPSIELLCALYMSENGEKELRVLNPLLSDPEASKVMSDLSTLLLTVSRAQLLSRALLAARKLQSTVATLITHVRAGGAPPAWVLHAAADAHALADQLAALLGTKRSHVRLPGQSPLAAPPGAALAVAGGSGPVLDPRILVFEFCAGVVLRPAQVALLGKLVGHARTGSSVCHQMLMGEGKTTVISPLLALLLADGLQLVMQVVPAPLLSFTLQVMRSVFRSGPLQKPVTTFAFDRRTEVTERTLSAARIATEERSVMVSTPASVKAFMLKLLELLHLLDTGMYPRMHSAVGKVFRKLLHIKMQPSGVKEDAFNKNELLAQAGRAVQLMQIWRGAVAVIDEVDIVLHPLKSELNWPLGDRHPLDFAPTRWELPWFLLDAVLAAAPDPASAPGSNVVQLQPLPAGLGGQGEGTARDATGKEKAVLQRLTEAISTGLASNLMQRVPHLVLLSDAFYNQTLRPILADWLLLWLRRQGLRDVTDDQALRCLSGGAVDPGVQSALTDRHVKMLNLGSDWLTFLLPHALRKVSRVHYGLLSPKEMDEMRAQGGLPRSRRFLAVPFVGKDAPSHASEFAHPDVAIGVTILAYRYEGMRQMDFGPALRLLRQGLDDEAGPLLRRPSSLMWISWMHAAGRRVRGTKALLQQQQNAGKVPSDAHSAVGGANGTGGSALEGVLPPRHRSRAEAMPPAPSTLTLLGDSVERGATLDAVVGSEGDGGSSDILPLHLLDVCDVEYMELLFSLLSAKPLVIKYYLESLVFPDVTAHQPMKLSSNGQDVGGSMLFSKRIAFSGTPSSLLPLEMGDCVYQMGDDAKMLRALTEPSIVSTHALPPSWDVKSVLDAVASLDPPALALIDTGALITGMSNLGVAEYLLPKLPASVEGVVYLERGGHKKILLRTATGGMDLERCGLPKESRFSFFDQVPSSKVEDAISRGSKAASLTLGCVIISRLPCHAMRFAGAHDGHGHSAGRLRARRAHPRQGSNLSRLRSRRLPHAWHRQRADDRPLRHSGGAASLPNRDRIRHGLCAGCARGHPQRYAGAGEAARRARGRLLVADDQLDEIRARAV